MGDFRVDPYDNFPISGQYEGVVSGTVYNLPDEPATRIILAAHPSNSGTAWVGNVTGTVNNQDGFPLTADGPQLYLEGLKNLSFVLVNFDAGGDRVCWIVQRSFQRYIE
jgi:hypothetical protein